MQITQNLRPPYPSVAVAVALAGRSHALAGSAPAARARLALVVALACAEGWSEETLAAHAMGSVDWMALARHFREAIPRLQTLTPSVLLARLCETSISTEVEVTTRSCDRSRLPADRFALGVPAVAPTELSTPVVMAALAPAPAHPVPDLPLADGGRRS